MQLDLLPKVLIFLSKHQFGNLSLLQKYVCQHEHQQLKLKKNFKLINTKCYVSYGANFFFSQINTYLPSSMSIGENVNIEKIRAVAITVIFEISILPDNGSSNK